VITSRLDHLIPPTHWPGGWVQPWSGQQRLGAENTLSERVCSQTQLWLGGKWYLHVSITWYLLPTDQEGRCSPDQVSKGLEQRILCWKGYAVKHNYDYIPFPIFTHTHNGDDTLPRVNKLSLPGIWTPDRSARSKSPHRLHYPDSCVCLVPQI